MYDWITTAIIAGPPIAAFFAWTIWREERRHPGQPHEWEYRTWGKCILPGCSHYRFW